MNISPESNFPLGKFVCITGVSGSGKSSLIRDTLYPAVKNILNKTNYKSANYGQVKGIPVFREKLASYVSKKFNTSVTQENIMVSPGARFSIYTIAYIINY